MTQWLEMVRRVAATDPSEVPGALRERAALTIADTVGVVRAGHREPEMRGLVTPRAAAELSPAVVGGALVLDGTGRRTTAASAAFLNATAGSFLEQDEGIRPTGHPAMQVIPAALAAGEIAGSTNDAVIAAIVVGYEVTARLFRAFALTHPRHPHGHLGAVGAAVAVARLYDVDATEAASIAATSPLATSWNACLEGATARNTWMGQAAASGVTAALLAEAGFRGSHTSLSDVFGDPSSTEPLTEQFDLAYPALGTGYYKLHSACALTHAALDAVFAVAPRVRGPIEAVHVETVENNMKIAVPAQHNDLSTRFSLPYAVATALVRGATDADALRWRPEVAELERRVTVSVASDLQASWPAKSPARVTVSTASGSWSELVENPHGYWTDPLSTAELEDKFTRNVGSRRGWAHIAAMATSPAAAFTLPGAFPPDGEHDG